MANLVFKYGAMKSGKTIDIVITAHNYSEQNKKVVLIKPQIDKKGESYIESRTGLKRKVDMLLGKNESLLTEENYQKYYDSDIILVDEVQMLNEHHSEELFLIAHQLDIPVYTYGLKSDAKGELFPGGVGKIIALADQMEEIKTTNLCACGKNQATMNARKINGLYSLEGETILIDGIAEDVEYIPLCGDCFLEKVMRDSKVIGKLKTLKK